MSTISATLKPLSMISYNLNQHEDLEDEDFKSLNQYFL
jgi:hypothetical protein